LSAIECEKVISRSDIKLLDLQALKVARVDASGHGPLAGGKRAQLWRGPSGKLQAASSKQQAQN